MKLIEAIIVDGKVYDVVKNNAGFDDCVKCEFNKGDGCLLEITGICPATNYHYFKRRRSIKRRAPKHEEMSRNRQKKRT